MGPYLYRKIDPNICLYRGYVISSSEGFMNDDLLKEFDLQPICEKKSEINSVRNICYNTLRFTDVANSSRIFGRDEKFPGINQQVICK